MDELFAIVGIYKHPLDTVIPDGKSHVVFLPLEKIKSVGQASFGTIAVLCTGDQWDMIWWIYRLEMEYFMEVYKFDEFVEKFLTDLYNEYNK